MIKFLKELKMFILELLFILIFSFTLHIGIPMLVNAGFDFTSTQTYQTTAQIETEEEYYYNQYDNSFYYQQLNDNAISNYQWNNRTSTASGVSYTVNNSSITVNGTGNSTVFITLNSGDLSLPAGTYYCYYERSNDNGVIRLLRVDNEVITNCNNSFTLTSTTTFDIQFRASSGLNITGTYNNVWIKKGAESVNYYNPGYTGLNNYNNVTFYGRMYDLKPNTQYTLLGGKYNQNTLESFNNIYLGKNCKSANLNNCEFQLELNDINYNENNGSYTFRTPNYGDYKGVYYLINNSAVNGSMPILDTGTVLYEGILNEGRNYYKNKEQNYYIETNIESLMKNNNVTYNFNSYPNSRGVALLDFTLTRYNIEGKTTSYNYSLLQLESIVDPNHYSFKIPNLYDLELNNNTLIGSMPDIKFNNSSDYNSNNLNLSGPTLKASYTLKNQYLANSIGFVGKSLFKGFYNSYGMQGNTYNDQLVLTQNFEFKNRVFKWYEFTTNINDPEDYNNKNQLGFYVTSLGVKNTLTDNTLVVPPNGSGIGNNYEIYKTCGNILEDFGCNLSNGITWVIYNIPIIGPLFSFVKSLYTGVNSMISLLDNFTGFGIMFALFILFIAYCIIRKIYNR